MNRRTPIRQPPADTGFRRDPPPAYPRSRRASLDESPALSAQQIPTLDDSDVALPAESETAEALGLAGSALRDDIRQEEQQRHPDLRNDDDDAEGVAALAEEFHQRLSAPRRR